MTGKYADETPPDTEEHEKRDAWWGVRRFVFSIGVLTIFIYSAQGLAPLLLGPPQDTQHTASTSTAAEQTPDTTSTSETAMGAEPSALPPSAAEGTGEGHDAEVPAAVEGNIGGPIDTPPPAVVPPVTAPVVPAVANEELNHRISALEEKLAAQDAAIESLKQQLAKSVSNATDKANTQLSTVMLLSQLRTQLEQGQPYSAPLAALERTLADNPKTETLLLRLAAARDTGLPTLETLKTGFAEKLKPALLASKDQYGKTLGGLITIRKVGSPEGADDEAILARTETQLRGGALAGALHEAEQLSPPAADVLKPWAEQAKLYLDTRSALDALYVAVAPAETQTP